MCPASIDADVFSSISQESTDLYQPLGERPSYEFLRAHGVCFSVKMALLLTPILELWNEMLRPKPDPRTGQATATHRTPL